MGSWRVALILVGGLLATGGAVILTKASNRYLNGVEVNAMVQDLKSECFVSRLQTVSKKWDRETIDCATETRVRRASGNDKNVQVLRYDSAVIEFPLQGGSMFKADISQQPNSRHGSLRVGDRLPIVYDPKSPSIARAPMGLQEIGVSLAILVFGAVCVLVGLKFNK